METIHNSMSVTDKEHKDYDTVIAKLDSFFNVYTSNVIFQRAQFNRINQLEGELREHFIMELYRLAKST